ncbi:MAG TPA: branched-chain amino acid ABC transporter permease [Egibacteraceae bacterium]|nr:branched-chain amino acid ABC transporter permease [Egibacteraceae bacterium]
MTTVEETEQELSRINRIRNARAEMRKIYAPLSAGWRDTKEAYGHRAERRRARFANATPLQRALIIAIPIIIVYVLPQLPFMTPFYRTVLVDRVAFYVLLALGLNVVVGFAGLLDLGYVAFYAIGAYTAAYFTGSMPVQPPFTIDPFLIFPIAVLVTMLAGVLLGLPTLRLRGDYLAIVTLGFHEIVRITLLNAEGITNGARGVPAIPQFELPFADPQTLNYIVVVAFVGVLVLAIAAALWWRSGERRAELRSIIIATAVVGIALLALSPVLGRQLAPFGARFADFGLDPVPYYYLAVTICIIMVLIVRRLADSRVGRAWVAIREDELAAEAMGIPTLKMKVWAFAIGASTAGFAGVMLAVKTSFINPQNFLLLQSIIVLAMVVFGGMGSIVGAIAGAIFIGFTQEALRDFDVVPFIQIFIAVGTILAVVGLLIVLRVIKTRVGPPYGWWLLGIGVLLAALSPWLRIPFLRIAENPEDWRLFILGLILLAVMILRPEGLFPSGQRRAELHGETTAADEKLATTESDSESLMTEGSPG